MRRKMIIALAATAMLGAAAIADNAIARGGHGGGGGHGGHGGMGGMHAGMGGMRGGSWGGARVGAWGGSRAWGHSRFVHNRFAFRHHRFHRNRFLFATSIGFGYPYYDCYTVRRVWSPWGWTWRRIWVCG